MSDDHQRDETEEQQQENLQNRIDAFRNEVAQRSASSAGFPGQRNNKPDQQMTIGTIDQEYPAPRQCLGKTHRPAAVRLAMKRPPTVVCTPNAVPRISGGKLPDVTMAMDVGKMMAAPTPCRDSRCNQPVAGWAPGLRQVMQAQTALPLTGKSGHAPAYRSSLSADSNKTGKGQKIGIDRSSGWRSDP